MNLRFILHVAENGRTDSVKNSSRRNATDLRHDSLLGATFSGYPGQSFQPSEGNPQDNRTERGVRDPLGTNGRLRSTHMPLGKHLVSLVNLFVTEHTIVYLMHWW